MLMSSIKCIAFDLDDTLLDTSGILVPEASRRACQAMINYGLECELQQCLDLRGQLTIDHSHTEIFPIIAERYSCTQPEQAIAAAIREFYNPEIPDFLPPLPGVIENLEYLSTKYQLFVVTMGNQATQLKKVNALKISHYFEKIYVVDSLQQQKKRKAFEDIIASHNIQPEELLSIGNRISSEIRDANVLGAKSCHFYFGEHRDEPFGTPFDKPHFIIKNHRELRSTCNL